MHVNMLFDKLNAFESSDAIATFLKAQGIKGDIQDGDSCPISNWILTETEAWACTTTENCISVEDFGIDYSMTPNDVVVEFICKFDNHEYPFLISDDYSDDEGY